MQVATHPLSFLEETYPSCRVIKCDVLDPLEKQAAHEDSAKPMVLMILSAT
jgi:hypothetical protein